MHYNKNFYQIRDNDIIFERVLKEVENIGYYKLPFANIDHILNYSKEIRKKYIIVIGIGGSSLGSRAIYEFLSLKNGFIRKIVFIESTDPADINSKLGDIDINDSLFLFISKSGTTVETISMIKYLSILTTLDKDNSVVITGEDNPLRTFAENNDIKIFTLDENIGGRFSVFSVVGLLPLALIGVDIENMLNGAKKVYNSFFNKEKSYNMLIEKARFMVENKSRFNINVVFSYSSSLEFFNKWYIQLWAESLGKINVNGTRQGLTPIGLVGPVDQHSFLQLIMEGTRDKTVTFITIDDFEEKIFIPKNSIIKEMDYLDGISFSKLINNQADATIQAINDIKKIPYDVITIDKVDEYNIAELMYSYELLVSIIGSFLQINTYDQPGVESGKIILKDILKNNS